MVEHIGDEVFKQFMEIIRGKSSENEKIRQITQLANAEGNIGLNRFCGAYFDRMDTSLPLVSYTIAAMQFEVMKFMIKNGGDAKAARIVDNIPSGNNRSGQKGLLHELAYISGSQDLTPEEFNGMAEAAAFLIEKGADPNLVDEFYQTPLLLAMAQNTIRFKPKEGAKNWLNMLVSRGGEGYDDIKEVAESESIPTISSADVEVDKESSIPHLWFIFYHQVNGFKKEYEPAGGEFRGYTYTQAIEALVRKSGYKFELNETSVGGTVAEMIDSKKGVIRDILNHTSIATRVGFVKEHPECGWILPLAMQKSKGLERED